ncbi:MAG TPA: hypothetical protein VL634_20455 [Mycobacterium sp.]|jgi:hypothetical protein|nr:hypothetical protein [Mycobacterium sp.]
MKRSRITVGLAALAAVALAGCSSSSGSTTAHSTTAAPAPPISTTAAPAAPAVAHGVKAAIGDVPWAKVGPGWMLAMWSPETPHMPGAEPGPDEQKPETDTTTLYLVDPQGNRYTIATFGADDRSAPEVLDWSADGSHALLGAQYPAPSKVTSIDLHTGAQTTIPVDGYPRYSHLDGKSILVATAYNSTTNEPGTLKRLDLAGNEQQSYPTELGEAGKFGGDYLESLDGTQLVLATHDQDENTMVVTGTDGKIVRTLRTPMQKAHCSPVRWWSASVVLANCRNDAGGQLWEVPLDGGTPTALTAVNSGQEDDPGFGGDIGDDVAYQLPSGTFLQSAGACGTMFLSRLTPDMHTTRVKIPGVSDSVIVAGATADKLLILGKVGCSGTTSMLTYDPAANTSTVLLGPPINGGGVTDARLFPGQE